MRPKRTKGAEDGFGPNDESKVSRQWVEDDAADADDAVGDVWSRETVDESVSDKWSRA